MNLYNVPAFSFIVSTFMRKIFFIDEKSVLDVFSFFLIW